MAQIRRYGPSMVAPQVAPRPELGRGAEMAFAGARQTLNAANNFVRPAVEQEMTKRGEQEAIDAINSNTFEPRQPFTVRDAAFNESANRIISTKASAELDDMIRVAQTKADGNVGALQVELEKAWNETAGSLPEIPGLETALRSQYERAAIVANRNAVELTQRRAIARQTAAANEALQVVSAEAERLALTGGTADEIGDLLAASVDMLADYGPRSEFTVDGKTYEADPKRAGILSQSEIEAKVAEISRNTSRLIIEAEFQKSEAPGQFVQEFRKEVFEGNSPLPAGESLELIRALEGRARAYESQRVSAANAAKSRLVEQVDDRINTYVSLSDAGVPVAIPESERVQILADLAPYPEEQREAQIAFEVADAAVATHGMSGAELTDYVSSVRSDIEAAAQRGELDLGGAAVIQSLEDRLKKLQDAVSAETIGLPLVDQLIRDGVTADQVNYDQLRENAQGNQDVINQVNEVEAFHRQVEQMTGMTAAEREAVTEGIRTHLSVSAALGADLGDRATTTTAVLDRLDEWSEKRAALASSDPYKFAASVGVPMASLEGVESLADVGKVIVDRVTAIAPKAELEGVENAVPITRAELDLISEVFEGTTRAERAAFLGEIVELGEDRAAAVFAKIGQSEPALYAAGMVYAGGNQQAASVILRGTSEAKLSLNDSTDPATARTDVLGPFMEAGMIEDGIEEIDAVAMSYARGKAIAAGGAAITLQDLKDGYKIALGQQEDKSGGPVSTNYGPTIAPPGYSGKLINAMIGRMDDDDVTRWAKGMVATRQFDGKLRYLGADDLRDTIEELRPHPDDPYTLIPRDANGGVFLADDGDKLSVFTITLTRMPQ